MISFWYAQLAWISGLLRAINESKVRVHGICARASGAASTTTSMRTLRTEALGWCRRALLYSPTTFAGVAFGCIYNHAVTASPAQ